MSRKAVVTRGFGSFANVFDIAPGGYSDDAAARTSPRLVITRGFHNGVFGIVDCIPFLPRFGFGIAEFVEFEHDGFLAQTKTDRAATFFQPSIVTVGGGLKGQGFGPEIGPDQFGTDNAAQILTPFFDATASPETVADFFELDAGADDITVFFQLEQAAEDLTPFFNTDADPDDITAFLEEVGVGWAQTLTFGGNDYNVIFDDESYVGGEMDGPQCWISDADLVTASLNEGYGKTVVIEGFNWIIEGVRPDGTGITVLRLLKSDTQPG